MVVITYREKMLIQTFLVLEGSGEQLRQWNFPPKVASIVSLELWQGRVLILNCRPCYF